MAFRWGPQSTHGEINLLDSFVEKFYRHTGCGCVRNEPHTVSPWWEREGEINIDKFKVQIHEKQQWMRKRKITCFMDEQPIPFTGLTAYNFQPSTYLSNSRASGGMSLAGKWRPRYEDTTSDRGPKRS